MIESIDTVVADCAMGTARGAVMATGSTEFGCYGVAVEMIISCGRI